METHPKYAHLPQAGDRILIERGGYPNLGQVAVVLGVRTDRAGALVRYTVEDVVSELLTGDDGERELAHFARSDDMQVVWIRINRRHIETGEEDEWLAFSDEIGQFAQASGSAYQAILAAQEQLT